MTRFVPVVLVTVLLLAFGGIAAACSSDGGGSGGTLTLEEYFQRVDELVRESEQRGDEAQERADAALESAESLDDSSKVLADIIEDILSVGKDFRSGLGEIEPPSEIATLHSELVAFYDVTISTMENLGEKLQGADSSEVEDLLGEFEEELTGLISGAKSFCIPMQDIANENDIAFPMQCGD